MNLRRDNRIVVDLNKCQFARFYYRNQHGQTSNTKPLDPTYEGRCSLDLEDNEALFHPDYPSETLLQRFKRRGVRPDVWTPEVLFKLSANHCLIYTGKKAVSLWAAWREKIFNSYKAKKAKT